MKLFTFTKSYTIRAESEQEATEYLQANPEIVEKNTYWELTDEEDEEDEEDEDAE